MLTADILNADLYTDRPEPEGRYDVVKYSYLSERFPVVHESTNFAGLSYADATREAERLTEQDNDGATYEAVEVER